MGISYDIPTMMQIRFVSCNHTSRKSVG